MNRAQALGSNIICKKLSIMKILLSLLMTSLLLGHVSGAMANTNRDALLQAADTEAGGEYTRQRFVAVQKKPFDPADSRKKLLLIGDSHAQDFLNSMLENGYLANYQIRTRHIPTSCQIVLGEAAGEFIQPKDAALCADSDNLTQAKAQIAEADVVILSSRWKEWAAKLLPDTIKQLELRPEQRLVVIGAKDFGRLSLRNYLGMSDEELLALRNKPDPVPAAINRLLRDTLGDEVFVDPQRLLCGDGMCRLFTDELKLISYDGGHLTPDGARYVGKLLFEGSVLGKL